jgi:hypothetical protein
VNGSPLRIVVAGAGASRLADALAQATQGLGVDIEPLPLAAPTTPLPRCAHVLLVADDDDAAWRDALSASTLPWSVLHGDGETLLERALDALTSLLPRNGLLTRLQQRDAAHPAWRWVCEKFDSPECEHALLRR